MMGAFVVMHTHYCWSKHFSRKNRRNEAPIMICEAFYWKKNVKKEYYNTKNMKMENKTLEIAYYAF